MEHFYSRCCYLSDEVYKQHGEITEEIRRNLDKETKLYKFMEYAAIRTVVDGRPDFGILENIRALPEEDKIALLRFSTMPKEKLLDWLANDHVYQLPDKIPSVAYDELRALEFIKEVEHE